MASPTTPEMQKLAAEMCVVWMREQKQIVRDLLGQWVSEMEPTLIYGRSMPMQIEGVGLVGDPSGSVIIKNPKFVAGLFDTLPHLFGTKISG